MKLTITAKEVLVVAEDAETFLTDDPQPRNRRRRRTAEEIAAGEAAMAAMTATAKPAAFA